jgi:hypothetical protein
MNGQTDLKSALEEFEKVCDGGDDAACLKAAGDVLHACAPHAGPPNQGGQPAAAAAPQLDVAGCQQALGRLGAKTRQSRGAQTAAAAGGFNWMQLALMVAQVVQQLLQQRQP